MHLFGFLDDFVIIYCNNYIAFHDLLISNGDSVFRHAKLLVHISAYTL